MGRGNLGIPQCCRAPGHAAPPFKGSFTTSLALVLIPLSQVTLHSPQAFQLPTLQSTRFLKLVRIDMMTRWEESTWASRSVAGHCLLQSRTRCSSILWLFNDLPCSRLGSTVASRTAFAPSFPIANFAVNWKFEALVKE